MSSPSPSGYYAYQFRPPLLQRLMGRRPCFEAIPGSPDVPHNKTLTRIRQLALVTLLLGASAYQIYQWGLVGKLIEVLSPYVAQPTSETSTLETPTLEACLRHFPQCQIKEGQG